MIEILVNDGKSPSYEHNGVYFTEIDLWAKEHCKTYTGFHVQDVSDVSYQWDEIACYFFQEENADTTLFRLKWL